MKRLTIILMILGAMLWTCPMIQANNNRTATKTEQVTNKTNNQETDKNPVVGQDKKGHTIHQGAKGGLYYWTTIKRGDNAGKVTKRYLTKAEKEEFYKSHPNVKKGGQQ
jgi:hypothetical protein